MTSQKTKKTKKTIKLVALDEMSLTAISTLLIPTLAKEDAKKEPSSGANADRSLSQLKRTMMLPLSLKEKGVERKRFLLTIPYNNQR